MEIFLNQADIDALELALGNDYQSGDRGLFYLTYYEILKAKQAAGAVILDETFEMLMMQVQVSTYSGFFGGTGLLGNAIAKFSQTDTYNQHSANLDQFSWDVANGLFNAIVSRQGVRS